MTRNMRRQTQGFFMLELAIALVIIGGLVAMLVPLGNLLGQSQATQEDRLRLQQARQALLEQAVSAGGLPSPVEFKELPYNGGMASSHRDVSDSWTPLAAGWPGALPGHVLGVATSSPLQTVYWYDTQAALRGDPANGFRPLVAEVDGQWTFRPIRDQFDPDKNPTLSTGANGSQLCRHLNSLLAMDQRLRTGVYERTLLPLTLPRFWTTGQENRFFWDSAERLAGVSIQGANPLDEVFENSSAAAFAVVRRQPPALRRLDRQNNVYAPVDGGGLDPTLEARGYEDPATLSAPAAAVTRGFRVYENPRTPRFDDPAADLNDYAGLVEAVSLGEFAAALRQAGQCRAPADACAAHQLFVRFANYVGSQPPSGTGDRLTLRWELADAQSPAEAAPLKMGDVSSGSTTDGICLDAFSTVLASAAPHRRLRLSFFSPSGEKVLFRDGLLVDPADTSPLPAGDQGVSRWFNLDALSAVRGGQTVTVACTGFHAVSAEGVEGELVSTGALPTCTAEQRP